MSTGLRILCCVVGALSFLGCPQPCSQDQVERDGRCATACNSDYDCPGSERCDNGACVAGARNGAGSSSSAMSSSSSQPSSSSVASMGSSAAPSSLEVSSSAGPSSSSSTALVVNAATGGVETTFVINGETWKRHVFLAGAARVLNVTASNGPFLVTVVGAGGGGGAPPDGFGASAGGEGGFHSAAVALPVGDHGVVVGTGGTSGGDVRIGGGGCGVGGPGGASSLAGAWTAGGGKGGAGYGCSETAAGVGDPSPAADGGVTPPDRAGHGLDPPVGQGGVQAAGSYPGTGATAGMDGAVVVEYRVL